MHRNVLLCCAQVLIPWRGRFACQFVTNHHVSISITKWDTLMMILKAVNIQWIHFNNMILFSCHWGTVGGNRSKQANIASLGNVLTLCSRCLQTSATQLPSAHGIHLVTVLGWHSVKMCVSLPVCVYNINSVRGYVKGSYWKAFHEEKSIFCSPQQKTASGSLNRGKFSQ